MKIINKSLERYKVKEWLIEKYVTLKLSSLQIARLCNVNKSTILYWLKKYHIKRRTSQESLCITHVTKYSHLYRNKHWLIKKYHGCQYSLSQLSKVCYTKPSQLRKWMRNHNLPLRTYSNSLHVANRNENIILTRNCEEFIKGELLGDGNLCCKSKYSASVTYSSKYRKYIKWLINYFKEHNIISIISTRSYVSFSEMQRKWYVPYELGVHGNNPKRKWFKIVPRDIELTPLVCRQWYIGDGSIHHSKSKNALSNIVFSTNGFLKDDVLFLCELLRKKGFKAHRTKSNSIYMSRESTQDFLEYIGPCPEEIKDIYGYKWDYDKKGKK